MNIIEQVREKVKCESAKYKKKYNYDYWEEHVRYVVEYSTKLAEMYEADSEIVEIASILHDIAKIKEKGKEDEHDIVGAKIAGEILKELNFDLKKIERVQSCILNHSCNFGKPNIIEDICVCDGDILASLYNPTIFYYLAYKEYNFNYEEGKEYVKKSLTKKCEKLSDKTKELYKYQILTNNYFI